MPRQGKPKRPEPEPIYRPIHLKGWRLKKGLRLKQLAERVQSTHGTLSRLEHGLLPYTQPLIERLAAVFEIDVATLLTRGPDDVDPDMEALIDKVRRLTPSERLQAIAILDGLARPREEAANQPNLSEISGR